MAKDLAVLLEDRPGTLADLGEALGKAGVNIDGLFGAPAGGKALVHILVQDASAARRALQSAGLSVQEERDVLVVEMKDRPGELGTVSRKLAKAGVNINLVYGSFKGLVLGVDNLDKARAAVK